jgi:hypothetical protein
MRKKINDRSLPSTLEMEKADLEKKLKNANIRIGALEKALTEDTQPPEPKVVEKTVEVPAELEHLRILKVGDANKDAKPPEVMCTVKVNGEDQTEEILISLSANVVNRLRSAVRSE